VLLQEHGSCRVTVVSSPPRRPVVASPSPALRERFLEHRVLETAAASDALGRADFEWLATLGHNLHGSGSSFGFPHLGVLGGQIEIAAQKGDLRQLAELLARLASAVSEASGHGTRKVDGK
jgi:HPt (histidine-containing phosphotransfer) domain-containing protein